MARIWENSAGIFLLIAVSRPNERSEESLQGVARIFVENPQSFFTAENLMGAVVFTYFNINNCEANKISVG